MWVSVSGSNNGLLMYRGTALWDFLITETTARGRMANHERSYCAWFRLLYFYLENKKKNIQEQVNGCLAPPMLTCTEANLFLEQVFFGSFFTFIILLRNVMFCTCAMQLYRNFSGRAGANYLSSFYLICKPTASAFRECCRQSDTRFFFFFFSCAC